MKAKEFIPSSKPRNFVAKNAQSAGAGRHKDSSKKKDQEQGKVKHKKDLVPMEDQGVTEGIVASGPSKPLDDRAVRKLVWDTMKINADSGEQAIERALSVLAKKPQSRMVQDLQDKFQSLADRLTQGVAERVRDPEDWDEGNTEPGNNFAVYINGKKWKVFPGPAGAYADSPEERREFQRLKDMTQRKSQQTGKKWEVYVTGEKANEDVGEGWSDAMVSRRTGQPRTPYSVYIKGKKWKDFENDDHAQAVANKLKAKFRADGRDPETVTIAPTEIITGEATALEKFRKAADEREKKHDAAEKEMKARHARGEEDMKGSIDRLEKHVNNK